LLLEAFSAIAAQSEFHLVIAGDGPEDMALRAHATGLRRNGRVHFVGPVGGDVKTYLLQNALCVVVPSRISEGFPLVVLESYASARPVIGTQIPGLSEWIQPGRTGVLVPPESPSELARALARAIADREEVDRLGREARRFAKDHDWPKIAEMHLALFEDLVAVRGKRRTA